MSTEYEELVKEHTKRLLEKKYNSYGIINNLYRILKSMIDNPNGHKFFTLPEMGFYEGTNNAVHIKARQDILAKCLKLGWMRSMTLPNTLKASRKNYDNEDVEQIMAQSSTHPGRNKSIKRMKNSTYYTVTDEGRRIYKNIKEILDKLAS